MAVTKTSKLPVFKSPSTPTHETEDNVNWAEIDTTADQLSESLNIGHVHYKETPNTEITPLGDGKRLESPVVKVLVGPTKAVFYAHEAVLAQSAVLSQIVRGSSAEAATQIKTVSIPGDAGTLAHILEWLYGRFWIDPPFSDLIDIREQLLMLADLYRAADYYQLDALKAEVQGRMTTRFEDSQVGAKTFFGFREQYYDKMPNSDKAMCTYFIEQAARFLNPSESAPWDGLERLLERGGKMAVDIGKAQMKVVEAEVAAHTATKAKVKKPKVYCNLCGGQHGQGELCPCNNWGNCPP